MSALALPWGVSTPIVKIPSSTRGIDVVVVGVVEVGAVAASDVQPTTATMSPLTATATAHVGDDRRMAGL
jgi:hypothetical protein